MSLRQVKIVLKNENETNMFADNELREFLCSNPA